MQQINQNEKTNNKSSFLKKMLLEFFPVEKNEIYALVFSTVVFSLIVLQYTLFRVYKDGVVLSFLSRAGGTSPINLVKTYFSLPISILFTFFSVFLSRRLKPTTMFYVLMCSFGFVFGAHGLLFLPYNDYITFSDSTAAKISSYLPFFLVPVVYALQNWIHVALYVSVELFSASVVGFFWNTLNQFFSTGQAKRLYPLIITYSQIGVFLSAEMAHILDTKDMVLGLSSGPMGKMKLYSMFAILTCLAIVITYFLLDKLVLSKKEGEHVTISKQGKKKASFLEALKAFATSKNVFFIVALTFCYAVCVNFIDATWKLEIDKLVAQKINLSNPTLAGSAFKAAKAIKFSSYNTQVLKAQAIFTFILGMFSGLIRKNFSWLFLALSTPVVLLSGAFIFFSTKIFGDSFALPVFNTVNSLLSLLHIPHYAFHSLAFLCAIGSITIVFLRATKYLCFDVAKEIATINLATKEEKTDAKSGELLFGKPAKGFAAVIQSTLNASGLSNESSGFYVVLFGLLSVVGGLWVMACLFLYKNVVQRGTKKTQVAEKPKNNKEVLV